MTQDVIIGVDGGGTGCRAQIGTLSSGVIGQSTGGPANITSDFTGAIHNIQAVLRDAVKLAGFASVPAHATIHIGVAGVMSDADSKRVTAALPYQNLLVTDDRTTSVAGALGNQDGYLLAIGTGTIIACQKDGQQQFIGGWGFTLSDHGSGAWLGQATLERVLLCHDMLAAPTPLTQAIFDRFDRSPSDVVNFATTATATDFATFAPQITQAAQDGDVWGQQVMEIGATCFTDALTQLGYQAGDLLCLSGGVGPSYAKHLPASNKPIGTALDGAFALAAGKLT